ncbi:MAG: A24 family peptidase [Desulfobacterota bacterium]|nr:A24 family peptidase [Thermodesulfobacteriota bacterium]
MTVAMVVFLFLFGAVIGSFLNVCIARIPEGDSIVFPGSRCLSCKTGIRWYDNIPLLSYILLGAKCRYCRAPIAFRYFLVELLTPMLLLGLHARFGMSPVLPIAFAFTAALVVITFIDLRHQIIPDVISIPGALLCIALSPLLPWLEPVTSITGIPVPAAVGRVVQALLGAAIGGGVLYLFAQAYFLLTKREGMGFGDVKLLAMIGAFLGWKGALMSLMIGAIAGSVVGALAMALKGKTLKYAIPFGPFLSLGALCTLLYGEQLIAWYIGR